MITRTPMIIAILGVTALAAAAGPAADWTVDWRTIDGGGGTSTGGRWTLSGTIGQPDAGPSMTGGVWTVAGGYWTAPAAPTCLGDTDGNGVVNIDDIVNVILDFGTNGLGNGGDVDGSGVVDIDDVVIVVLNLGRAPARDARSGGMARSSVSRGPVRDAPGLRLPFQLGAGPRPVPPSR